MIINEKNVGKKIAYRVSGNFIYIGADDDLALNLKKYERETEKQVDVTMDKDGMLLVGTDQEGYFVAQITVPKRAYDGSVAIPFNPDNCTLDLWSIEVPLNKETPANNGEMMGV